MVDKASIARMVMLFISLALYFGIDIPEGLHEYIVDGVVAVVVLYVAWKNNYISKKGKKQKEVLEKHNLK